MTSYLTVYVSLHLTGYILCNVFYTRSRMEFILDLYSRIELETVVFKTIDIGRNLSNVGIIKVCNNH